MNGILNVGVAVLPADDTDVGRTAHGRWLGNVDPRDAAEAARQVRGLETAETGPRGNGNGGVANIFAAAAAALEDFAGAEASQE